MACSRRTQLRKLSVIFDGCQLLRWHATDARPLGRPAAAVRVGGCRGQTAVRYVALLRGINVGHSARVPMADLRLLLEGIGLYDVVTYLNSGNVVFSSELGAADLASLLEGEFERTFGARVPTLVKTSEEVISIARAIPSEWGNDEGEQTYVAYLFSDVDQPGLVAELPVKPEFLSIFYIPGAIVWNI